MYMWVYSWGPFSYGYTLDSTSTDLRPHVPWVYREPPFRTLNFWENISTILLKQNTENSTRVDYSHILVGSQIIQPMDGWSSLVGALKDWAKYFCWTLWYIVLCVQPDTHVRFLYFYQIPPTHMFACYFSLSRDWLDCDQFKILKFTTTHYWNSDYDSPFSLWLTQDLSVRLEDFKEENLSWTHGHILLGILLFVA